MVKRDVVVWTAQLFLYISKPLDQLRFSNISSQPHSHSRLRNQPHSRGSWRYFFVPPGPKSATVSPHPLKTHLLVRRPSMPTGPLACMRPVLIPTSAPAIIHILLLPHTTRANFIVTVALSQSINQYFWFSLFASITMFSCISLRRFS